MKKSLRHSNKKPTHPGAILREDVLPSLSMSQTEFARRLGVSRLSVSELLLEKRAMTTNMAARLGKLLGNGPDVWIALQTTLDLWKIEQAPETLAHIQPIRKTA